MRVLVPPLLFIAAFTVLPPDRAGKELEGIAARSGHPGCPVSEEKGFHEGETLHTDRAPELPPRPEYKETTP